jgi:hypothetical protein
MAAGQMKSAESVLGDLAALRLYVAVHFTKNKRHTDVYKVNLATMRLQRCILDAWLPCSLRADGILSKLLC